MTFQAAAALLVSAFLFGGALLYSSAFATFLFRTLPAVEAGGLLRRAFASYYLWLIATSALAALLYVGVDGTSSLLLLAVALSTVPVRQYLMPAVNAASDRGENGASIACTARLWRSVSCSSSLQAMFCCECSRHCCWKKRGPVRGRSGSGGRFQQQVVASLAHVVEVVQERVRLLAVAVGEVGPQQFSLDPIQLFVQRAQLRLAEG